jgi:hypothetical protein
MRFRFAAFDDKVETLDIRQQIVNGLVRVADALLSQFSIIPDNINPQLFIP